MVMVITPVCVNDVMIIRVYIRACMYVCLCVYVCVGMCMCMCMFVCMCVPASFDKSLYVYPEIFGNVSLSSCGDAPSCGTTMATFNGISAKSNGGKQCTGNSCSSYGTYGYQYQCVELAQRYFGEKFGTTPIWYGNAIDLCNTYPSGVSKTNSPIPGDLVVFDTGTYGHVAVITSVGGGLVNVIEQNSSPTGTNSYSTSSDIACYLHADKNSGSSCNNAGWYCGGDGVNKDPNVN